MYVAHTVPGLEEIAQEELRSLPGSLRPLDTIKGFDERTSLVLVRSSAELDDLLHARMIEDLFALAVDARGIHGGYSGAKDVRAVLAADRGLDAAASLAAAVRPRHRRKTTFRVIARMAGSHAFRRADLGRAAALAVADRFPDWVEVEEEAQFELWVSLVEDRLVAAIRLSDNELRTRDYRTASLPAALKPTVAYAMARLSEPRDDDIVLDPMCGAGTLLIERAHAGRYRRLLGGDAAEDAVRATAENVGPRYQPIGITRWDARYLPLPNASVSAVLANLPFGKQMGSHEVNRSLYPALLDEWLRITHPGGRMALLTSESSLLRHAALRRPRMELTRTVAIVLRGQPATIHLFRVR